MVKNRMKIFSIIVILSTIICTMAFPIYSENAKSTDKVTDTLTCMMANAMYETDRIPVYIRLKDDEAEVLCQEAILAATKYSTVLSANTFSPKNTILDKNVDEYISVKRTAVASVYSNINQTFSKQYLDDNDIIYICKYTPIIIAELTISDINELKCNDNISFIDYYAYLVGEHNIEDQPLKLSNEQDRSNIDYNTLTQVPLARQTYAVSGRGVTIGILDLGNLNKNHSSIMNMDVQLRYSVTDVGLREHPTTVAAILYSIAPEAKYYYTTHTKYVNNGSIRFSTIEDEIEWLIEQGSNIINMSMALFNTSSGSDADFNNVYGAFSAWLDETSNNTNVAFVKSSGNEGSSGITSGGMANNIITVGNYDDNMTATYEDDSIHSSSSYYACTHEICLYKPDICAPASHITIGYANNGIGTSYAAPQITGIAALMMQLDTSLKSAPEDIKSILTAGVNMETAHHYRPYGSSLDNYKKYGAGLVNAYNALSIISNNQVFSSYLTSTASEKEHTINVTSSMVGQTIRISLAYLKHHSYSLANIDLYVKSSPSTTIARSLSIGNNVEIIEFCPDTVGTYTLLVDKFGTYSSSNIYYCVSWICTD